MSALATSLRAKAHRILTAQDSRVSDSVVALLNDAADEIERLQRELDEAKEQLDFLDQVGMDRDIAT